MLYTAMFSGTYECYIEVDAENEEEALEMAEDIFEDTDANQYLFIPNRTDVFEGNNY